MKIPESFCTICTENCKQELIGFLLSLSIHHMNAKVYIICDSETLKSLNILQKYVLLELFIFNELDEFSNFNRQQMEDNKIFGKFLSYKMKCMKYALKNCPDTMFVDSDTIILDKLYCNDKFEVGLSPQFILPKYVKTSGYYNAGLLWTNNVDVCSYWEEIIDHNHSCAEQINMDKLKKFNYYEFSENYNLQTWRFLLGLETTQKIASYVNVKNEKIFYKNNRLKFIHTHFNSERFKQINNFFIGKMKEAKLYKELAIIYRVINDKWMFTIPKQPLKNLFYHKNDSFRELPLLFKLNNPDVDIKFTQNTGHCWLEPNILLYDRPTLEWVNNECSSSSLILLGNGDINNEGKKLKSICKNVEPWIFWPRRPMIVEKILKKNGILGWNERENESIFIGNFENNVQQKYRKTNEDWETVLSVYHCTAGKTHKFTNEEYLMQLRNSKYGLCLRGYGSKCHREVELMAFGTVPIVTNEVCIESYYDKPIENVHYIKVNNVEEFKTKIYSIPQKKWENMSKSCYEWYQRNVFSKNAWTNMLSNILYNKKPVISCFGASITQQSHGYVKIFKNIAVSYEIKQHGYGGMHLNDAGIFYIDNALIDNPKFMIVDWFSTGFIQTDNNTLLCIENIIYKCHKQKCIPIFSFPYRKDNSERLKFYNYVKEIITKYNCYFIDFSGILNDNDLNDIVHPNINGSSKYTYHMYNLIKKININEYKYLMPIKNKFNNIKSIDVSNIKNRNNVLEYDISGEIYGILNKIGPYSPIVEIYDNNKFIREEIVWDKYCAYERTHINFKNIIIHDKLKIVMTNKEPNYIECNNNKINFKKFKKELKLLTVYYS